MERPCWNRISLVGTRTRHRLGKGPPEPKGEKKGVPGKGRKKKKNILVVHGCRKGDTGRAGPEECPRRPRIPPLSIGCSSASRPRCSGNLSAVPPPAALLSGTLLTACLRSYPPRFDKPLHPMWKPIPKKQSKSKKRIKRAGKRRRKWKKDEEKTGIRKDSAANVQKLCTMAGPRSKKARAFQQRSLCTQAQTQMHLSRKERRQEQDERPKESQRQ